MQDIPLEKDFASNPSQTRPRTNRPAMAADVFILRFELETSCFSSKDLKMVRKLKCVLFMLPQNAVHLEFSLSILL